jgi:hypothetical protein
MAFDPLPFWHSLPSWEPSLIDFPAHPVLTVQDAAHRACTSYFLLVSLPPLGHLLLSLLAEAFSVCVRAPFPISRPHCVRNYFSHIRRCELFLIAFYSFDHNPRQCYNFWVLLCSPSTWTNWIPIDPLSIARVSDARYSTSSHSLLCASAIPHVAIQDIYRTKSDFRNERPRNGIKYCSHAQRYSQRGCPRIVEITYHPVR